MFIACVFMLRDGEEAKSYIYLTHSMYLSYSYSVCV